jgi:Ca2+-binding EF-hand superfamily protein
MSLNFSSLKKTLYPTGFLWRENFRTFFSQVYPHANGDQLLENLYRAFDIDKSGFISFQELLIGLSLATHNDPIKKLGLIFNIYDRDSSGYLEKGELLEFLRYIRNEARLDNSEWIDDIRIEDYHRLNKEEFIYFIMLRSDYKEHYLNLIKIFG